MSKRFCEWLSLRLVLISVDMLTCRTRSVFADVATNATFDYSSGLTTIAVYNDPDGSLTPWFLCDAHAHNVRVVLLADFPHQQLLNKTAQAAFVSDKLRIVQALHMDGINLDFESPINKTATLERAALNDLVRLTGAFLEC